MSDVALTITHLFDHGRRVHSRSVVSTFDGDVLRRATFAEVGERAARLGGALRSLGVAGGEVVGTLMWNTQEHLEAYFAVPGLGAVLHTLNPRLPAPQLSHIINQAEDKVVLLHASMLPVVAAVAPALKGVSHYVVVEDAPLDPEILGALGAPVLRYEDLLGEAEAILAWPEIDEWSAAGICYTSGTTGDPKGVVYSHRSTFLHAFGFNNAGTVTVCERDQTMIVVPMFHVNAWGWPYVAWMAGAGLIMPGRFLGGASLAKLIGLARPTLSAGVPTIWNDLLQYAEAHPGTDLSSLKAVISGGSALPRTVVEGYDRLGVRVLQGWGMTETSPVCAVSEPPADADPDDVEWRLKTGRIIPGVEVRIITDSGEQAPWDGATTGEIEVRGPWITSSYYLDPAPEKFRDGWLRTGDIGTIDSYGYLQITDRLKDVIKSGGEWISSVALENELMGHPEVAEASVVGVADARWGERPLAVVVRREGSEVTAEELRDWLGERVAKWWIPERWAFVDSVPKTSVGKFDKKAIRARESAGDLEVVAFGS